MTNAALDKIGFIIAYFEELDSKIAKLATLARAGYRDEALTLALVYIDGLAQRLAWPSTQSGANFVRVLASYTTDVELGLVHPLQLTRALDALSPSWQFACTAIRETFPGPEYQLVPEPAITHALAGRLTRGQRHRLKGELWRGTIAAVAYYHMRNPAVHALGASGHSFSSTTYLGRRAQSLNLDRLQRAAHELAVEARRRSEATSQWFGNDECLAS